MSSQDSCVNRLIRLCFFKRKPEVMTGLQAVVAPPEVLSKKCLGHKLSVQPDSLPQVH